MAKEEADATDKNHGKVEEEKNTDEEAPLLDQMEGVAKQHLVFKWVVTHPDVKVSATVAAINLADITPSTLYHVLHSLLITLYGSGLGVCMVVGDGASEERQTILEPVRHSIW